MDTLQQIKDEFLVCPICLRNYTNPKLLPCLHTFCGQCLADYVHKVSKSDTVENGSTSGHAQSFGFKCPVCRAETKFEVSGDDELLSGGFTDNHLITNLMEKIDMHSLEKNCESCSARVGQGQKAAKAEVWCQTCKISFCDGCIKAHNVIKACRDHVVLSLDDMRVNPLQSMKTTQQEIPCTSHPDKTLEFYCIDCRVAICSTCVAVQHRRCDAVETCADSAQKLKPESETVIKDLEIQEVSLGDWEQEHQREVEELVENREEIVRDIKSIRLNMDQHLTNLERAAMAELDAKHSAALQDARDRLREIENLKKNLENTNRFLKNLVQYGSDSEFLSVFDKVRQQANEMNDGIDRRKISKLCIKHKFSLDPNIARTFETRSIGKIIDVVDMNRDTFNMNGNGLLPPSPFRKTSIKRTGTFKVDKVPEPQTPSKNTSRGSLSTPSPSTSSDSMSSQEMLNSPKDALLRRQHQQATSARLSAGSTGSLPRQKRVQSTIEFRKTQNETLGLGLQRSAKTPPLQRRGTANARPPTSLEKERPQRPARRSKTPDHHALSSSARTNGTDRIFSPPTPRRAIDGKSLRSKSPAARAVSAPPRPTPVVEKTNAQLLCSFNGRVENETKKCWPLDVAVLDDGTPVITDFHNKKIKAFDASGAVMCDVLLPSWPHGIAYVQVADVAVTLPEISTLVFVTVNERSMSMKKRIKTVKQYRGICCHAYDGVTPSLIVSCCASNNQSIDMLSLDGEIIHSFRHDNRHPGRTLFTWPYYVTTNTQGEIIVSDCETKTGLLYMNKNGDVKHDCLSIGVVIQDPRGICTDMDGNVYLADKSAHVIHSLTPDGKYRKCVVTAGDELHQPIAVCVSPFGHIIVTQDNGDVKVFAID